MELNRRIFFRSLARFSLALLVWPVLPVTVRRAPLRFVEALRGRWYPGPIKPANQHTMTQPGRWAG